MTPRKTGSWFQGALRTGKEAASQFVADKCPRLAAALAYYTLISLVPLLYLVTLVTSLVFSPGAAREALIGEAAQMAGPEVAQLLRGALDLVGGGSGNVVGLLVGAALLVLAATTVLGELQNALNQVWGLQAPRGKPLLRIVRERGVSMLLVLTLGLLFAGSLAAEAVISNISSAGAWQAMYPFVDLAVSVGGLTVFLAAVYKVVPDAKVRWADVWWGAGFTAVLLAVGKVLIGFYVGRSATASAYGAAGALAVLLLWVYFASMLFFFGAELTEIRAASRGTIRPRRGAIRVLPQRIPLPIELAPPKLADQVK